ncbi:MAG: hypothetical protein ABSD57_04140 [Verrucomicrobiota bacterium]|jgi:hypothetical protein
MTTGKIQPAFSQLLMPMACLVFMTWNILAVISYRCLYADGCHEFIKVLQAQDFVSLMWSRHFAFHIFEFPLVLAIKLGVTNMRLLRLAFGLGCFLPWPAVLMFCHWMSPKHFWVVVVACAGGYLNAAYMAVGEHILAHAFFWPSLFAIVFARPLKPLAALILLTSATCLLFSYESQLFLCPPLAALSLWRIAEEASGQTSIRNRAALWSWAVLLVAAGLFIAASGIGLYAVLKPEIPSNFLSFQVNVKMLLFHKGWTLTWSIIWGCVMLAVWLSKKTWDIIRQRMVMTILLCALIVWGTWPLLAPHDLEPAVQYDNRILDLLVPLMLLPVVLILRYRPAWIESQADHLGWMAAILLMVQSIWQISATWQWHEDVGKLQGVLSARQGIVPLHSSILGTSSMKSRALNFDWTWPCLSIALNPGPQIQSLVCSEYCTDPRYRGMFWQPFDPLKIKTLPDLRHYGLDFSDYVSALQTDRPGQ